MKKTILLLAFLIGGNYIFAQNNTKLKELMNDLNITWIGEYETYFPFDIVNISSLNDSMSSSAFWNYSGNGSNYRAQDIYSEKFQNFLGVDKIKIEKIKQMWSIYSSDEDGLSPGPYQSNLLLFQWVKSGKLKAYYDADLTKEMPKSTAEKLGRTIDTVFITDPQTLVEIPKVIVNEAGPEDFQLSKAKYYVYFNNKNMTWNIYMHSIAPVIERYDNEGNFVGYENIFWVPVENSTAAFNYTDINYPQVLRSFVQVSYDKAKVLKKANSSLEVNEKYLKSIRNGDSKKQLYFDLLGDKKMEMVENFGVSVDTIVLINPETFEEIIKVNKRELDSKNIPSIRLAQDWYWDEKLYKLKVNFVAYAPIVNHLNSEGEILFATPGFWEIMMKTKFDKQAKKKK